MKKISAFILSVVLAFCLSISVFAQGQINSEKIIVPISDENSPIIGTTIGTIQDPVTRAYSLLTTSIIRNGTKTECQIYLNWSGGDVYSSWKFSSISVDNGNWLFPKVYGTISGKTIDVTALSSGSAYLGSVDIPTSVTQARVNISGLMGYNINSGSWLSAVITGKLGNIN